MRHMSFNLSYSHYSHAVFSHNRDPPNHPRVYSNHLQQYTSHFWGLLFREISISTDQLTGPPPLVPLVQRTAVRFGDHVSTVEAALAFLAPDRLLDPAVLLVVLVVAIVTLYHRVDYWENLKESLVLASNYRGSRVNFPIISGISKDWERKQTRYTKIKEVKKRCICGEIAPRSRNFITSESGWNLHEAGINTIHHHPPDHSRATTKPWDGKPVPNHVGGGRPSGHTSQVIYA